MPSDNLPPVAVDRRGTNVDEAVAFYEDVYASQDIHIGKPTADGFTWRYRAVGDDELTLGTSAVDANRWGTIGQHGTYILAWTTTPGIVLDIDTRDAVAMPPNVPVMYPSGRPFEFSAAPGTQHMIRFDGTFLENVAAAQLGAIPGPLQFRNLPDPEQLERLRQVIRAAAPELLHPDTDRWRRAAVNMLVAEAAVDAFHATPDVDIAFHDGPATMRFAQEWMVANAHRHITSTDVAQAAGINARALQAAFQRHAHTTPWPSSARSGSTESAHSSSPAKSQRPSSQTSHEAGASDTSDDSPATTPTPSENDHPTRSADRHGDSAATQNWVPIAGLLPDARSVGRPGVTGGDRSSWSGSVGRRRRGT